MPLALSQTQLDAISAACRRHHVMRLHAFGSVLRPDYRPGESDIDLLVEFELCDARTLYRSYFALLNELRQGVGGEVDLVMNDAITNPYIIKTIEASKKEIYAA